MSPWLRLVGAVVAVVVAALLLKALPPLLVLALFLGGLAYANHALKAKPRREAAAEAKLLGLKHETVDPFGLLGYPLGLFSRGAEGRIEDLVWGTWRGLQVKRFDYSFEPAPGTRGAERHRFSCAIAAIEIECPPLVVEPRSFVARFGARVPMGDVELVPGRFDQVFDVRSNDRGFARSLIDRRMMEWLLGLGEGWGFEMGGRLVVAYGPRYERDIVTALETVKGFVDRIPEAVRSGRAGETSPGDRPGSAGDGSPGP